MNAAAHLNSGILLVITGPTASGKDTVVARVIKKFPSFQKVVTTTTRLPREGEIEGVNHFFLTRLEFEEKAKRGEFLETNEYSSNSYGTDKKEINKVLRGENLIWRIDPSAAAKVPEIIKAGFKKEVADQLLKRTLVIYLKPESEEILVNRLKKRGFSDREIKKRLTEEKNLWQKYHRRFKKIVINREGRLEEAAETIADFIQNV